MPPFKAVHSTADHWAHAAKECADALGEETMADGAGPGGTKKGGGYSIAFIYVTDDLAGDLSSILIYLRRKTGIDNWVGSVGLGVCWNGTAGGDEFFERPALVVLAARLPEDGFCIFPAITGNVDQLSPDVRGWIENNRPIFGVVHGDPANEAMPELIGGMAETAEGFLTGGLTASFHAPHQVAMDVTSGGLSGVMFSPELNAATGLSQGCMPVGESHVISDCLDNIIVGLDGRRALDVLKEDIGEGLAENLDQVAGLIHAAIPIEGSDTGDYMVRTLVGIDPSRGWLAIGETIEPGGRILFVRRDRTSAEVDLAAMAVKLKKRIEGAGDTVKGGLYFSCVARGPAMFEEPGREIAIIRETFGAVPLIGFFGNGEISNNRLYGYTGVLVLFS